VAEAGRDSAAWTARSPLAAAAKIAPPVLLVRSSEGRDSTAAAQAFAEARAARQLYIETRLNGVEPRPVHRIDSQRVAIDFLRRRTKGTP